jgi:hypothetical protein
MCDTLSGKWLTLADAMLPTRHRVLFSGDGMRGMLTEMCDTRSEVDCEE